jgi:undecaprenyl diphosphate synthase
MVTKRKSQRVRDHGLDLKRLPSHVAIIMDGNGRWARRRGLPRVAGHAAARAAVRDVVRAASDLGLSELTLYTFSMENWERPRREVSALMHLLDQTLAEQLDEMDEGNVHLRALGRLDRLPKYARVRLDRSIQRLSQNDGLKLNLAISYGGRAEIVDAARAIAKGVERGDIKSSRVDDELFRSFLYVPEMSDPDLLIRTSGELRISNFLLWQIAYSEIYVTNVLWPDFRRKHLYEAIRVYQRRDRRFGRLGSPSRRRR